MRWSKCNPNTIAVSIVNPSVVEVWTTSFIPGRPHYRSNRQRKYHTVASIAMTVKVATTIYQFVVVLILLIFFLKLIVCQNKNRKYLKVLIVLPLSHFQSRFSIQWGAVKILWTRMVPVSRYMNEFMNLDTSCPYQNDSEKGIEGVLIIYYKYLYSFIYNGSN